MVSAPNIIYGLSEYSKVDIVISEKYWNDDGFVKE
jgi:hypothetical protein